MSKGLYFRAVYLSINVDTLCFFCKYYRHMKMSCHDTGNSDSRCFNRKNLVDRFVSKQTLKFFSHFIKQFNIHLMIQKIVHFQYISFFYNTVFSNSLFQKFHFFASFVHCYFSKNVIHVTYRSQLQTPNIIDILASVTLFVKS